MTNFVATYFDPGDEAVMTAATEAFVKAGTEFLKSVGRYVPFLYMNYALPTQLGKYRSYGWNNCLCPCP